MNPFSRLSRNGVGLSFKRKQTIANSRSTTSSGGLASRSGRISFERMSLRQIVPIAHIGRSVLRSRPRSTTNLDMRRFLRRQPSTTPFDRYDVPPPLNELVDMIAHRSAVGLSRARSWTCRRCLPWNSRDKIASRRRWRACSASTSSRPVHSRSSSPRTIDEQASHILVS